jgi:hypothetical protein
VKVDMFAVAVDDTVGAELVSKIKDDRAVLEDEIEPVCRSEGRVVPPFVWKPVLSLKGR